MKFRKNKFDYRIVGQKCYPNGRILILRQTFDGQLRSYEVIRTVFIPVSHNEKFRFDSLKGYDYREKYPRDEAWGVKGFTCVSYDRAKAKFHEIAHGRD